jgi:hypothetical protein
LLTKYLIKENPEQSIINSSGYAFGYLIMTHWIPQPNNKNKIIREYKVDTITGYIFDYSTDEYLGIIKEEK